MNLRTAQIVAFRFKQAAEPVLVRHLASGKVMEIARQTLRASPHAYETIHNSFVAPTAMEVEVAKQLAPKTTWRKPDLVEEREEIERTAEILQVPADRIVEAARAARMIFLPDDLWVEMANTDSWETDTIEKAIELARMYDKDVRDVLLGMGSSMAAPLVVMTEGGPMLVGGNTRLMSFHGLGVRPMVLLVDIRDPS